MAQKVIIVKGSLDTNNASSNSPEVEQPKELNDALSEGWMVHSMDTHVTSSEKCSFFITVFHLLKK